MKITKRQLRRIIKEEKAKLMEQPDIPDIMGAIGGGKFQPREEFKQIDVEDAYVSAIRKLGARSVIRAIIEELSKNDITDDDHREVLRVLDYESY